MTMTLHSGQMKPDNWEVIFTAYLTYTEMPDDCLYNALAALRAKGRHYTFDSASRLWFQHEDDAALIMLKFSR